MKYNDIDEGGKINKKNAVNAYLLLNNKYIKT